MVLQLCSFARLLWALWVLSISIRISESACQFVQRSWWDRDCHGVESIDDFGENCWLGAGPEVHGHLYRGGDSVSFRQSCDCQSRGPARSS